MDIVILTSSSRGSASYIIPILVKSNKINISTIILTKSVTTNRKNFLIRKLKKIKMIGFFGSLIGVLMRKWYTKKVLEIENCNSIEELSSIYNIPLIKTKKLNSIETINALKKSKAKLGVSLGNSYIGKSVFTTPDLGFINIHHELLPEYKNAQSIIWQIFNKSESSGYTIHQIDSLIDNGKILYRKEIPINFTETLSNTVALNYLKLRKKSADGLLELLTDFNSYKKNAKKQTLGSSYTTPSLNQFIKIYKNFIFLRNKQKHKML